MLTELHCHTNISDNNFTTEEIIKKAAEKKKEKRLGSIITDSASDRALCVCVFRVSAGNDDGSVLHWR